MVTPFTIGTRQSDPLGKALFALVHFKALHFIISHFPSYIFPSITSNIHMIRPPSTSCILIIILNLSETQASTPLQITLVGADFGSAFWYSHQLLNHQMSHWMHWLNTRYKNLECYNIYSKGLQGKGLVFWPLGWLFIFIGLRTCNPQVQGTCAKNNHVKKSQVIYRNLTHG
jgi:hypothetical protein